MDALIQSLHAEWANIVALTPQIVIGLAVFIGFYLAGKAIGRALGIMFRRTRATARHELLVRRVSVLVTTLVGTTVSLHIFGLAAMAQSLLATGGVMAIVLGFAFREIGENFLAGVFLAFDRSFDVGDLIQSGGIVGTVSAVELRHVNIRKADGCDIFIPSSEIFKNALYNYTRDGLRRGEFTVGIDYGDDPEKACSLLLETIRGSGLILGDPKPAVEISGFTSQYVEIVAYFWTNTFSAEVSLPALRTMLMALCRRALLEAGFTFSSNVTTSLVVAPVDVNVR